LKVLRVELELRSRFLKQHKINDPYDFAKLVEILPGRHIKFVRINGQKLRNRLRGMDFSPEEMAAILEDVAMFEGDVWSTLHYLREAVEMKNSRRVLDPLDLNDVVLDALQKWAAMWPVAPKKLKKTP
jgi:hypothetical protein